LADQAAQRVIEPQHLEDADAATVAGASAPAASRRVVEDLAGSKMQDALLHQGLGSRGARVVGVRQRSHSLRTSRWPTTQRSDETSRKSSTPRSISRATASAALLVCRVVR